MQPTGLGERKIGGKKSPDCGDGIWMKGARAQEGFERELIVMKILNK